jgi:TetR/AcrR family transcriptional regulator, ethionamide resistance regulator
LRSVIRTHPSRERRREEIRAELAAAIERLLEQGLSFAEISVERLCREAGTSRATFYQYFQDKGDLLSQITEATLRAVADSSEFWWHVPEGSSREDLREVFRRVFALYRLHHGLMSSLSVTAAHDRAMRERLRSIVAWAIDETTFHIEQGIADGTINRALDARTVAPWLCWMLERGHYDIAAHSGNVSDRTLDAVAGLIWNVLYRPAR